MVPIVADTPMIMNVTSRPTAPWVQIHRIAVTQVVRVASQGRAHNRVRRSSLKVSPRLVPIVADTPMIMNVTSPPTALWVQIHRIAVTQAVRVASQGRAPNRARHNSLKVSPPVVPIVAVTRTTMNVTSRSSALQAQIHRIVATQVAASQGPVPNRVRRSSLKVSLRVVPIVAVTPMIMNVTSLPTALWAQIHRIAVTQAVRVVGRVEAHNRVRRSSLKVSLRVVPIVAVTRTIMSVTSHYSVPQAPIHRIAGSAAAPVEVGRKDSHQQAQVSPRVVPIVAVTPMIMSAMSRPYVPWAPIRRIVGLAAAPVEVGRKDSHQQAQVSPPVVPIVAVTPMIMSATSRPSVPWAPIRRIAGLAAARVEVGSHQQAQVRHPVVQIVAVTPMIMSATSRSSVLWVPIHRIAVLAVGQLHRLHHQRQPRQQPATTPMIMSATSLCFARWAPTPPTAPFSSRIRVVIKPTSINRRRSALRVARKGPALTPVPVRGLRSPVSAPTKLVVRAV